MSPQTSEMEDELSGMCRRKGEKVMFPQTCEMEDGLEPQAKAAHFKRVLLLDAGVQHADPLPVTGGELCIVVHAQCWPLHAPTSLP